MLCVCVCVCVYVCVGGVGGDWAIPRARDVRHHTNWRHSHPPEWTEVSTLSLSLSLSLPLSHTHTPIYTLACENTCVLQYHMFL